MILDIALDGGHLSVEVADEPPLGHRFWRVGGWAGDPVDPKPYGGTHCLALALVDAEPGPLWLCAMEQDASFRLLATHDLFPAPARSGAAAFARAIFRSFGRQPRLL